MLELVKFILLAAFMVFFLCTAWICGDRGDWFRFTLYLVVSIILAIWSSVALICHKVDEKFNRLEKFLDENRRREKEEKTIKQDTNKSADS